MVLWNTYLIRGRAAKALRRMIVKRILAVGLQDQQQSAWRGEVTNPDKPRRRVWWRRGLIGAIAFVAAGNLAILFAFLGARVVLDHPDRDVVGIDHLREVTDDVWRGNAPTAAGYAGLAEGGVTTIVDLRAERDIVVDRDLLQELGLVRVHIPMRDGQAPTREQVDAFLAAVEASPGRVYVHCGAGVGRTGTMAAVLLVERGAATPGHALARNLSVGPPSLEQIVFVAGLADGSIREVSDPVTLLSRLWDAPRRIYTTYLRQAWSN